MGPPQRLLYVGFGTTLLPADGKHDAAAKGMNVEGPIKYASIGDAYIAYRVFGDGPRDIVLVPGTISHVELLWEMPSYEHLLKRLTAFARVITFDKRGQGLSDRVAEQSLEERVGDVRAVMDAAGSESATIYGWSEGGPMCLMFAATHPARASGLAHHGQIIPGAEANLVLLSPNGEVQKTIIRGRN